MRTRAATIRARLGDEGGHGDRDEHEGAGDRGQTQGDRDDVERDREQAGADGEQEHDARVDDGRNGLLLDGQHARLGEGAPHARPCPGSARARAGPLPSPKNRVRVTSSTPPDASGTTERAQPSCRKAPAETRVMVATAAMTHHQRGRRAAPGRAPSTPTSSEHDEGAGQRPVVAAALGEAGCVVSDRLIDAPPSRPACCPGLRRCPRALRSGTQRQPGVLELARRPPAARCRRTKATAGSQ